ncbi:MAG: YbaB/EbfC family nucleoid-associated protein [Cryomorphaceae bacterium]|nr:MAG: YbaB/EbfC family nucleoid-associated protein [Cryomorphaceae bacterium]
MFGDLMGKLHEMQQNVKDAKERLETVSVAGESSDGRVRVIVNGNKVVKSVHMDETLRSADPEELEDLLILAINRALEQAEKLHKAEMSAATGNLLPPHLSQMLQNS